jgi:plasmid replication initiation protein
MTWGVHNISNRRKQGIRHEHGNLFVDISTTGDKGIATYHDNDILIFLTSHLVQAINNGDSIGRRIFFTANEFFRFSGREHSSGARYELIWDSLTRLQDTFIHTNIKIGGDTEIEERWNWLPKIKRIKSSKTGKSIGFEVDIAEAIYRSINQSTPQVLTLDRKYFEFRSGFMKWLYLYARKSAGKDGREWIATERLLHTLSGSSSNLNDFRTMLNAVVDNGELADYQLRRAFIGKEKSVAFIRKKHLPVNTHKSTIII